MSSVMKLTGLVTGVCLFQAQVLYDFTAEPGNNELSVRQGEAVTVLDQVHTDEVIYQKYNST